jgi:hypothetical protein
MPLVSEAALGYVKEDQLWDFSAFDPVAVRLRRGQRRFLKLTLFPEPVFDSSKPSTWPNVTADSRLEYMETSILPSEKERA